MKRLLLAGWLALIVAWAGSSDLAHAAHQNGNIICQTTQTAGTGTLDLDAGGCDSVWTTFISQISSGSTVTYTIVTEDETLLETGIGTFTDASPDTLARTTVLRATGGGTSALDLPAGTHKVYLQWNTASFEGGVSAFDIASLDVDSVTGVDSIDATTESTIEAAIDTLANLTSIQGRTVTLADAGANAFFGWDDTASAYENLTNAEAEAIMEPLIDTLANLTSVQSLTITLADAGADAVWGWDDSAAAYENLTGAEVAAAIGDNIALSTNTTGVYVAQVADGTGVDGSCNAEGCTYTPTIDATELTDLTFGSGGTASIAFTYNLSGTDPVLTFGSATAAITGTFTPEADNTRVLGTAALTWSELHATVWEAGNATDTTFARSAAGTATIEGVGIVRGATGGTDNAILRADGTGGTLLQNSVLVIADTSGAISGAASGFSIEFFGASGTDSTVNAPGAGRLAVEGVDVFTVAGTGATSTNGTINVAAGTCITANANDIAVTADCIGPTQIDETASYDWTGIHTFDSDAVQIDDTNASHQLVLTPGSDLSADRVFTITTGDAARTLTISANATLNDADYGDITTSSSFTSWNIDADTITTTELADNAVALANMGDDSVGIDELDLVTGDTPSDGECLTYDTGTGGGSIEAVACGGGGVSDGDKGDITVSSSGTVWDVDPAITVDSTADAVDGIVWTFEHSDPSPDAGDDPFDIVINAGDDQEKVGGIQLELVDDATTTEDTSWIISIDVAGANVDVLTLDSTGAVVVGTVDASNDVDAADDLIAGDDLALTSDGSVINFNAGDCTLTDGTNMLTMDGCDLTTEVVIPDGDATRNLGSTAASWNAAHLTTIELGADSDTTVARSGAGQVSVETVAVILNDATGEGNVETFIDTLANLTSVQGRNVTYEADPNLDVLWGWDDIDGGYENLLLAEIATEASPAAGDFVLIYGAEGDLRKVDWSGVGGGSGANTALSNLASVAINTSLTSDTDDTDDLGTASIGWNELFLGPTGTIEFNGDTGTTLADNGAGELTIEGDAVKHAGKQTIYIPAGAMIPNVTSGCGPSTYDSGSNDLTIMTCDFDTGATEERADFQIAMPKSWNESTVTAQFIWTNTAGASSSVVWEIGCVAISDDDTLNATMGTTVTVTDAWIATNDQHTSAESGALTCAGTPAEGDVLYFRVNRDTGNASDAMAGDARLIGVRIFWTDNASSDD